MAGRAAIRYAKAVIGLAKDRGLTETINADMLHIKSTIDANADLSNMLKSEVIKTDVKRLKTNTRCPIPPN